MQGILVLIALLALANFIYLSVQELAIRVAGFKPTRIGIGVGPRIAVIRLRRRLLVLHLLVPLGGYIKIQGLGWRRSGRLRRVFVALASPISLGVVACAILGPQDAIQSIASGFVEVLLGGALPWKHGEAYWLAIYNTANNAPVLTFAGLIFAKLAALNLLPIPPTSGGMALTALLFGRNHKAANLFTWPFLWLYLLLILGWAVALVLACL